MNIEPVNSMMTYQAQSARTVEKPASADTDVAAAGAENQVDVTTVTIDGTDETDTQQGGNGGAEERQQSQESVKKMVDQLNKKMENSEAVFGIHEGTNRITIKIVDKETKETLREFPPEKTLDMIAKVWELAGLLVDEKR